MESQSVFIGVPLWFLSSLLLCSSLLHAAADDPVATLRNEVATKGWVLFSGKTAGEYDLFLARPDGSNRRNLTNTTDFNEYGGKWSRDSRKMLYRRLPKGKEINHDLWGQFGSLVIANADGSNPVVYGDENQYPWATWSPDGSQIACLYRREGRIRIFDFATKKLVKEMPRQGIFQQLFWSPDGKRFVGTANVAGQDWNIVALDIDTQKLTLLTRDANCTPDFFRDPSRVIYSNRTPKLADEYGFTHLMQATADGKSRILLYGQRDKHAYFGCMSPDDKYVIFAMMPKDGMVECPMSIVRLADTPIIAPGYPELQHLYPNAKPGPVLHLTNLPEGFEPDWTYADVTLK